MISRQWKGICKEGASETYIHHLKTETFPRLAGIPGFDRASILTRRVEGGTEFQIVTLWRSLAAIEAFAGSDIERAVVPPFVESVMARFDEQVTHYEVADVFQPGPSESRPLTSESEIQALVDRETAAWDRQDAEDLVSLFHPDMVWPWPPDAQAHDPAAWVFPQGRYDRARWRAGWEELFRTHELVHNVRRTVRIAVSQEGDGAFAVVDVDTLWRRRSDAATFPWKGRAGKGYTKVGEQWFLILHTGLLDYGHA